VNLWERGRGVLVREAAAGRNERPITPRHLGPIIDAEGSSCPTARRVARKYMAAALGTHPRFPRRELGFRCRRIDTCNAGGGWVARCDGRRATVDMTLTLAER
jgi:hypothetical protein